MSFVFYPKLEQSCPNVRHCPHLGGAAIGTVVSRANDNELYLRQLHGTIDAERKRNSELFEENRRLEKELEQVKLELKLERQNKFSTNRQKDASKPVPTQSASSAAKIEKKRGAPVGHPGWFRKMPTEYDWDVDVPPPNRCPHCRGQVTLQGGLDPSEHLQEDVIDGQYRFVLYRHPAACCDNCRRHREKDRQ